jgi:hypothetical protein
LSTKIHTLVDALGNPVGFFLTGGQAHDLAGADELLPAMQAQTLIADKAYDADKRVIEPLAAAGKEAVIPVKANRKIKRSLQGSPLDRKLLCQAQAVPSHRNTIRQDSTKLPRSHPSRRSSNLAQLTTRPSSPGSRLSIAAGLQGQQLVVPRA